MKWEVINFYILHNIPINFDKVGKERKKMKSLYANECLRYASKTKLALINGRQNSMNRMTTSIDVFLSLFFLFLCDANICRERNKTKPHRLLVEVSAKIFFNRNNAQTQTHEPIHRSIGFYFSTLQFTHVELMLVAVISNFFIFPSDAVGVVCKCIWGEPHSSPIVSILSECTSTAVSSRTMRGDKC